MASDKPIHISSSLDIQSESLHEKIKDPSTAEVRTIDKEQPHQSTTTHTLATNNVKYTANGTESPKVTEGKAINNPSTDLDTSQL